MNIKSMLQAAVNKAGEYALIVGNKILDLSLDLAKKTVEFTADTVISQIKDIKDTFVNDGVVKGTTKAISAIGGATVGYKVGERVVPFIIGGGAQAVFGQGLISTALAGTASVVASPVAIVAGLVIGTKYSEEIKDAIVSSTQTAVSSAKTIVNFGVDTAKDLVEFTKNLVKNEKPEINNNKKPESNNNEIELIDTSIPQKADKQEKGTDNLIMLEPGEELITPGVIELRKLNGGAMLNQFNQQRNNILAIEPKKQVETDADIARNNKDGLVKNNSPKLSLKK